MHTRLFSSPRPGLTEPREIAALMAQDLNDLRRENRHAHFEALVECGWTRRQIMTFQMAAHEEATKTWSESRAPDDERFAAAAYDAASPQAKPFVAFDTAMRDHLADFEELQGCAPRQLLEGEA